jgi:hypothetical protein
VTEVGPDRESWLVDFAAPDGVAGFVRLELRRDEGVAWYWTYLAVPGLEGIVAVRDHEVPLPRQRLEIRSEGLWAELTCETPDEHWTFGLEAFGVRLDDPDDARRGEIGERLPVGLDLEWETPGLVHGEVLVGRGRWEVDGTGLFTHVTGSTTWAAASRPDAVRARTVIPFDDGSFLERWLPPDSDDVWMPRPA